jgi:hypothetical protein
MRQDTAHLDSPHTLDEHAHNDVRILIRHHMEAQGIWKLSPDPPVRLTQGHTVTLGGLDLRLTDEDALVISGDHRQATMTLHQASYTTHEISLPATIARRELLRGLTWAHVGAPDAGGVYIVDLLGELFVGEMRRRTHVLCGGIRLCRAELLGELWRICAREDPWLGEQLNLWEPSPWAVMLDLGRLLRHAPLWSSSSSRELVYSLLSLWRDELSPEAMEVMWDMFEERCEHVSELITSGGRGELLRALRQDLAAASATWSWLDVDVTKKLERIDALVTWAQPSECGDDEDESVSRIGLIDGEVWWA